MININLLPPELKMRRIAARRNASLISVCIVVVLVVMIIGIVGRSLRSTVNTYLDTAKNNVQKDTSQLDQYQDLEDLAMLINDRWKATVEIEKNRVYWSQVLQDLNNNVPADVQFENLIINSEKTPNFVLQGNTTTEREIVKFKDKLENSPFFKNVSFKSSSLSTDESSSTGKIKFTLEFDIEQKKIESTVAGGQ